ncbi:hypothetical protein [Salinispora arenicola]|uniref:hypothetical protein n=1 Tax=Salinispora arenicola TaxID=168697 RepID=UPI0027DE7A91|nr:hypothetical protein [Salinispora arenicola]
MTTVAGHEGHTTVGTADGKVTVLDRRKLEAGKVAMLATIDSRSTTALAVPYADRLLVAVGDDPARPADRSVTMTSAAHRPAPWRFRAPYRVVGPCYAAAR